MRIIKNYNKPNEYEQKIIKGFKFYLEEFAKKDFNEQFFTIKYENGELHEISHNYYDSYSLFYNYDYSKSNGEWIRTNVVFVGKGEHKKREILLNFKTMKQAIDYFILLGEE